MEPSYYTVRSSPENWSKNNSANCVVTIEPWEHTSLTIGNTKVTGRKSWGASMPYWRNEVIYYNIDSKSLGSYLNAVVIHHANNDNDIKSNESKQKSRGYTALGYHFFINKEGKIFEGRPLEIMGSHAGVGLKKGVLSDPDWGKIGIVLQGDYHIGYNLFDWLFEPSLPQKQKQSLVDLLNGIKQKFQVNKVLMHKDVNRKGAKTVCPGDAIYESIDTINKQLFNKQD